MDIQQIKKWRKSLVCPSFSEQDLGVVDFLIREFGKSYKSQNKGKCCSCSYWQKSKETGFGVCLIGKEYFVGNTECPYGSWKTKDEGE